jgi:hypothetical protein
MEFELKLENFYELKFTRKFTGKSWNFGFLMKFG